MKKLLELLVLNKEEGLLGVEIEVEGHNLPQIDNQYWKTVEDNSLRGENGEKGGNEYVFKRPRDLHYIKPILNNLLNRFQEENAKPKFSFRTSVHVHVNVQQLTYVQILNMIYTYLLLEEPLMEYCGESRKANRFCLRLQDAEGAADILKELFSQGEHHIKRIQNNRMRYAAINIESLNKYGSLEFRALSGCIDEERIVTWCTALTYIREYAMKMENPAEIYNHYIKDEAKSFMDVVFQNVSPMFMYKDMVSNIQKSFSLSIDLPFAYIANKDKHNKEKDIFHWADVPLVLINHYVPPIRFPRWVGPRSRVGEPIEEWIVRRVNSRKVWENNRDAFERNLIRDLQDPVRNIR